MARVRKWSDEQLIEAVTQSVTWGQVARQLNVSWGGNSSKTVLAAVERLNIDTAHFLGHSWNKGTGKGRDPEKARAAQRRWYENNREFHMARNRARQRARKEFMRELKQGTPCMDCGLSYPYFVMEFDHRDGSQKAGNLSRMGSSTWTQLKAEIEKCDIVCSNCHRFRTANRGGYSDAGK